MNPSLEAEYIQNMNTIYHNSLTRVINAVLVRGHAHRVQFVDPGPALVATEKAKYQIDKRNDNKISVELNRRMNKTKTA